MAESGGLSKYLLKVRSRVWRPCNVGLPANSCSEKVRGWVVHKLQVGTPLPPPLRPPARRPSIPLGSPSSGARELGSRCGWETSRSRPPSKCQVPPRSPAQRKGRGCGGVRGSEGRRGSRRLEHRGPGVGGGGRGKPQSRADLFTPKRPWAFQTSPLRARGGSYCLLAGPIDNTLVGQRGTGRVGGGRLLSRVGERPRRPPNRLPALSCPRSAVWFMDSGDPRSPNVLEPGQLGGCTSIKGPSYPTHLLNS